MAARNAWTTMLYAAKCYWPGVTERKLEQATQEATRQGAAYLGSLFFPDDELVLCLFDATSPATVRKASERADIPCERVMASRWLAPSTPERITPCANSDPF